jgi:hypothetical protein
MLFTWHHYFIYISIHHKIITMNRQEFTFYKVLIGIIYVTLAILIIVSIIHG